MHSSCPVCQQTNNHKDHHASEQMFGMGGDFLYRECSECGLLWLVDVPSDLSPYYPPNYYSFQVPGRFKSYLKSKRGAQALGRKSLLGKLLIKKFGEPEIVSWLRAANVNTNYRIMDVGCGYGSALRDLATVGFSELLGIDAFLPSDMKYKDLRVIRGDLSDVKGNYDFIMLNHSFEHMSDQADILQQLRKLIKPDKFVLIRIPVLGHAWRHYKTNWVALDAPRHLFLHSRESFTRLAKQCGFRIKEARYDSSDMQFWASEQYVAGIPLEDSKSYLHNPSGSIFSTDQIAEYTRRAKELNTKQDGDLAGFFLQADQ